MNCWMMNLRAVPFKGNTCILDLLEVKTTKSKHLQSNDNKKVMLLKKFILRLLKSYYISKWSVDPIFENFLYMYM